LPYRRRDTPAAGLVGCVMGELYAVDLILFVSFGVIFITLVGLGLGLPLVVRWLGLAQAGRAEHLAEHESELAARREALGAALKSFDAITDDRELSDEVVKLLRARHEIRANQLPTSLDPDAREVSATGVELTRELILAERKFIHVLLRDGKITDEIRRRIERGSESRQEMLLGLELLFGLESPPELQAQRRALQLKQLRERFQGAATTGANSAGDRLLLWCAEPGVADARDRVVRLPRQLVDRRIAARSTRSHLGDEAVEPAHELHHALEAFVGPLHVAVRGPHEERVQP